MSVQRVEFLVEELSMEAALRAMLPAWLGDIQFEIFPYQGKEDLIDKLPARLRGYSRFLPADWRIVVLVDRDNSSCTALKGKLEKACSEAGLITRSTRRDSRFSVVNRIDVEELEAWYFGDWNAVRVAFPRIDPHCPNRAGYRDPDAIAGGTWEAFERAAQAAGYFKGGLRKVDAARKIGPHLNPSANSSRSFNSFRAAIEEMLDQT